MLRCANSAIYRRGDVATTLAQAITRIGLRRIVRWQREAAHLARQARLPLGHAFRGATSGVKGPCCVAKGLTGRASVGALIPASCAIAITITIGYHRVDASGGHRSVDLR